MIREKSDLIILSSSFNILTMTKYLFVFLALALMASCNPTSTSVSETNPAAEGFNLDASDAKAIAIADEVMEASGSRAVWDATDLLEWNFFGSRIHKWNKSNGDLEIIGIRDTFEIKMNLESMEGEVTSKGQTISDEKELDKFLDRGRKMWINDSYWIFLPYKLKDSGVTLKYVEEGETEDGRAADVLELTFEKVGVTPNNKYQVYVDKETSLVSQWDFFSNYTDTLPRFSNLWDDYKDYNGLKLSSGRGAERRISGIKVGAE